MKSDIENDINRIACNCGLIKSGCVSDRWLTFYTLDTQQRMDISKAEGGYFIALYDKDCSRRLIEMQLAHPSFLHEIPWGSVDVVCVKDLEALTLAIVEISKMDICRPSETGRNDSIGNYYNMPEATESERISKYRIGQDIYKSRLIEYWNGRCAVTGLALIEVLIASHIKPWADSEDEERLDVYNGFLLAPNLDSVFDKGFITFDDDGKMIFSSLLLPVYRDKLGLDDGMRIQKNLNDRHKKYLSFHREHVYKP